MPGDDQTDSRSISPTDNFVFGSGNGADRAGYNPIYSIVCDAEVARAWAAYNPRRSNIHYLVPCERSVLRLRSYGVPEEKISITGFPFPLEFIGDKRLTILRSDLLDRLVRLDPTGHFWQRHEANVAHCLGKGRAEPKNGRAITITFAVGGAGAQQEIGRILAWSLRDRLKKGTVRLNLAAGVRTEVKAYFDACKADLLHGNSGLRVVFARTKQEYFRKLSAVLHTTDVLWTKPSELSFYCGLGIPIIMTSTIGSQENFNKKWLLEIHAGIPQEDPRYADQWIFDLLKAGRLAESAWNGFLNSKSDGTHTIREIVGRSVTPSIQKNIEPDSSIRNRETEFAY